MEKCANDDDFPLDDDLQNRVDVVSASVVAHHDLVALSSAPAHNLGLASCQAATRLSRSERSALRNLRRKANFAKHDWQDVATASVKNTFIHIRPPSSLSPRSSSAPARADGDDCLAASVARDAHAACDVSPVPLPRGVDCLAASVACDAHAACDANPVPPPLGVCRAGTAPCDALSERLRQQSDSSAASVECDADPVALPVKVDTKEFWKRIRERACGMLPIDLLQSCGESEDAFKNVIGQFQLLLGEFASDVPSDVYECALREASVEFPRMLQFAIKSRLPATASVVARPSRTKIKPMTAR